MKSTVLYHAHCADGFGSAWAAWKSLGPAARYLPVQYGQEPPPEATDCDYLFVLDFSYPLAILRRLQESVPNLIVIDHHKTAEPILREWSEDPGAAVVFDLSKSGAVLTWEYFHPKAPVPQLLLYVQDRDLWEWKLPKSKEIAAAIRSYPFDFPKWNELEEMCVRVNWAERLSSDGGAILRWQQEVVNAHVSHAVLRDLSGHLVPVVNTTTLMSEIGEALCRKFPDAPFSATYFIRQEDGKRIWSLRSRGDFDVGALAKSLGGGGHPQSAGFEEKVES